MALKVPHEKFRVTDGQYKSDASFGPNGHFIIPLRFQCFAYCIASDGLGWEHVSCHIDDKRKVRTPTWDEMCKIKDRFWEAEDVVVQFHPAKSQYVNQHPNVLHLWSPTVDPLPTPDPALVGMRTSQADE